MDNVTPAPLSSGTPAPVNSGTLAPLSSGTPVSSVTPAPVISGTLAPVDNGSPTSTGTPAPVNNGSPVPTVNPGIPAPIFSGVTSAPLVGVVSAAPTILNGTLNAGSSALQQFLEKNLTDDGALTMAGSSQNKAYLQLQTTNPDLDPSNPLDQLEITQKYILNTLFYSTTLAGETWMLQDAWTTKEPVCGPSSSWLGIDCDSTGAVTGLNLTTNSMNGTLPSELRGLTALSKYTCLCNMNTSYILDLALIDIVVYSKASIDLFNNELDGELPPIFGALTALHTFKIGSNFFSGTVPDSIQDLKSLVTLDVSRNFFVGPLPVAATALPLLESLDLTINDFTGGIPTDIGGYTSLRILRLSATTITSQIPSEIGLLTALEEFTVARSKISGTIPTELGQLTNLSTLSLPQRTCTQFIGASDRNC